MTKEEKKTVAKALLEKPVNIKVGWFKFKVKPLTFGQIYDISVYGKEIKQLTLQENGKINVFKLLIEHGNDARLMSEIFIICACRGWLKRFLFARYIRKHIDVIAFNELIKYVSTSFNTNFFLTSITFLAQVTTLTEPQTTPHGQQSEP